MFFTFGELENTWYHGTEGLWSASESTYMLFHYFHIWQDKKAEMHHKCPSCVFDLKEQVKHPENLSVTSPW